MADVAIDPALEKLRERLTDVLESNDSDVVIEAPECLDAPDLFVGLRDAPRVPPVATASQPPPLVPSKPRGWVWTLAAFLVGGVLAFVLARVCSGSRWFEPDVSRSARRSAAERGADDEADEDGVEIAAPPKLTTRPPTEARRPDARVAQRASVAAALDADVRTAPDDPLFQPL